MRQPAATSVVSLHTGSGFANFNLLSKSRRERQCSAAQVMFCESFYSDTPCQKMHV